MLCVPAAETSAAGIVATSVFLVWVNTMCTHRRCVTLQQHWRVNVQSPLTPHETVVHRSDSSVLFKYGAFSEPMSLYNSCGIHKSPTSAGVFACADTVGVLARHAVDVGPAQCTEDAEHLVRVSCALSALTPLS
mgnify:CR=1 FL=1